MDLETAIAIVETMIDGDDEYIFSEEKHEALEVALGCMNSIMYIKKVIK